MVGVYEFWWCWISLNLNFKSLDQEIGVKNKFEIDAKYAQKQNITKISVKEGKKKAQTVSVSELAIITLSTKDGLLNWGY